MELFYCLSSTLFRSSMREFNLGCYSIYSIIYLIPTSPFPIFHHRIQSSTRISKGSSPTSFSNQMTLMVTYLKLKLCHAMSACMHESYTPNAFKPEKKNRAHEGYSVFRKDPVQSAMKRREVKNRMIVALRE